MNKTIYPLLGAALLAVSLGAAAHEDKGHAAKEGPGKKEQQAWRVADQKAWGTAGDPRAVKRTIEITMTDNMRFTPDRIEVRQGETVKFVVKNDGKILHEMVVGTKKDLDEHAAMMVKFQGMEPDVPYMTQGAAGKTGQITWNFNRAGEFDFACLIAGHYQAGMVGKIKVVAATNQGGHGHKH